MTERPALRIKSKHLRRPPHYRRPQPSAPFPAVGQVWKPSLPPESDKRVRIIAIESGKARIEAVYFARGQWCVDIGSRGLLPRRLSKFSGKLEYGNFHYVEG